jgi:copper chaperone
MTTATPTRRYLVPDISCDHCKRAIETEVQPVDGVTTVVVDVAATSVTVSGGADDAIRAAIDDAGYDVAEVTEIAASTEVPPGLSDTPR